MTRIIKEYIILGRTYGIEDYEDGLPLKDHFFGEDYPTGRFKRFRLWCGGGGFGQADTMSEAQEKLFNYAIQNVSGEAIKARDLVKSCDIELSRLNKLRKSIDN